MGKEVFESCGLGGREDLVEAIKVKAGELDDLLTQVGYDSSSGTGGYVRTTSRPGNCLRMVALARTNLEQTVMWAVKAVSRGQ